MKPVARRRPRSGDPWPPAPHHGPLAHYHSPYWLWFIAFVGATLFQSAFTGFCPLEKILLLLGVPRDEGSQGTPQTAG